MIKVLLFPPSSRAPSTIVDCPLMALLGGELSALAVGDHVLLSNYFVTWCEKRRFRAEPVEWRRLDVCRLPLFVFFLFGSGMASRRSLRQVRVVEMRT